MINKHRTPADEHEDWNLTSSEGSRSDLSADGNGGTNGAPAVGDDDDSVPSDIFEPIAHHHHAAAAAAAPTRSVTVEDGDFVPNDIFQPVVPPVEAELPHDSIAEPVEHTESGEAPIASQTAVTPSSEGLSAWIEPLHHEALPETTSVEETQKRAIKTTDWFKPFPVAPPLPPLPLLLTGATSSTSSSPATSRSSAPPRPIVKQYPDPEPAVFAAAPRPSAMRADPPMMKTTPHYETDERTTEVPSRLDQLLRMAASLGASTLYLSSNARPSVRIDGFVQPLEGTPALSAAEIETHLIALTLAQHGATRSTFSMNRWSFELADIGRVRCVAFADTRGPGAVFDIAPAERSIERVNLSLDMQALATEREGIVIVAGSRASGKQAVIGAFIDLIDRARCGYLITVQREVSVHRGEGSLISQREAPGGLDEMLTVARAAQQENPDVLVLQDAHSAPLMKLAFDAAASGQLVIAGFSAPSAGAAIDRIINLFPPEEARQVQLSLAQYLRAVIGQALVPKIGGGRVSARELLLVTEGVSSVLAAGKAAHLGTAIAAGHAHGSVPLSESLVDLVQSGLASPSDAYRQAPDPAAFVSEMKRAGLDISFLRAFD